MSASSVSHKPRAQTPGSDRDESATIAAALLTVSRAILQSKAHDSLRRRAGVDLDRSGSVLLYKLYVDGDELKLSELAERLDIDAPAVTRKVQQLEAAGLVSRARDLHDARAQRISLTPTGRDSIERLLAAREEWIASLLTGWSAAERHEFARLLTQFATTITTEEEFHVG